MFFKQEPHFDFMRYRFITFGITAILVIGSIFLLAVKGLNFGIDFTGGTLMEIKTVGTADIPDLRERFSKLDIGTVNIQQFGEADNVLIRIPEQVAAGEEGQARLMDTVKGAIDEVVAEYRRVEFVGPQVGKELIRTGITAVLFSILGIAAYIWLRFEWPFGVASILGLLHDALITLGFFALTQIEFDLSTVAAVLLIVGYSINDTVVVFDRIRENLRKFKRQPLPELFNNAINQTLNRTIMTSLTTLLALIALFFFGGEVIRGFVLALILGIVLGTLSSIFFSAPMLMYIKPEVLRPGVNDSEIAN